MMPTLAPSLSPLLAAAAFDVAAGGGGVGVVEGEVEDEEEDVFTASAAFAELI